MNAEQLESVKSILWWKKVNNKYKTNLYVYWRFATLGKDGEEHVNIQS